MLCDLEMKKIKFIDLFAGLGGIRLSFEKAFKELGYETECVLTSEIKPSAIKALKENFEHKNLVGDICKVNEKEIEDFDFLLGGFPWVNKKVLLILAELCFLKLQEY